jgi:hypothetical protein
MANPRPERRKSHLWSKWIPRDNPLDNVARRRRILELAYADHALAEELWYACKRDLIFFINTFGWILEPRRTDGPKVLPFVTWPKQEELLLDMQRWLGKKDILGEKSRATGFTWMVVFLFLHTWLFTREAHLGLVSATSDQVDNPDDPDGLFQKLDFAISKLPRFLLSAEDFNRAKGRLKHNGTGSTIMGDAATGNVFRGGRKLAIGWDELGFFPPGMDYEAMASTQHVTKCRIMWSTANRPTGQYYDMVQDTTKDVVRLLIDWKDCPPQRAGLYTSENGALKIIDKEYAFAHGYPFILDGLVRSPYYDSECNRAGANLRKIRRELDRIFEAGQGYFGATALAAAEKTCREAHDNGRFRFDEDHQATFVPMNGNGPLSIWYPHAPDFKPPTDTEYAVSCDISAGTGGDTSSNSVACVLDRRTGEQVAQYVTLHDDPKRFANIVVALCKFFQGLSDAGAYLIWETNGPVGESFGKEIVRLEYGNVYRELRGDNLRPKGKIRKIGWRNSDEKLADAFDSLMAGWEQGKVTCRDRVIASEARQYVWKDGKVVHDRTINTEDESNKGKSHGDRVVAMALGYVALRDRPYGPVEKKKDQVPHNCMAKRIEREEERLAMVGSDSRW